MVEVLNFRLEGQGASVYTLYIEIMMGHGPLSGYYPLCRALDPFECAFSVSSRYHYGISGPTSRLLACHLSIPFLQAFDRQLLWV